MVDGSVSGLEVETPLTLLAPSSGWSLSYLRFGARSDRHDVRLSVIKDGCRDLQENQFYTNIKYGQHIMLIN